MKTVRAAFTYLMTSRVRDWLMVAPAALAALALALIGYMVDCKGGRCLPFGDALFRSINLLRFGHMPPLSRSAPELVIAPFLIPAVALLNGARLALRNLRREMRVVWAHRLRDHVIVCGLGDTGRHVVENLHAAGDSLVIITANIEDENSADCEQLGIPVLKGDARQLSLLNLAGLPYARRLIATCGSDAVNIEIALRARDALRARNARTGTFQVLPEMRSQWLAETVQLHRSAALGSQGVEFLPFNLHSAAVRDVLRSPGFARAVRHADEVRPRLVLAGFGETNAQLVLHAVQNFFALPGHRLRATVFDDEGEKKRPALEARFPGLMRLADIDFVSCTFAAEDPAAWSLVDRTLDDMPEHPSALLVIVALADDATSLHAALQFRERLDRRGAFGAPVFVRLREQSRLGWFMASLDGADVLAARLTPFGDLASLTTPHALFNSRTDALAQGLHASYLETAADPGDYPAAVPWPDLPERFKHSNRLFAEHLPIALNRLGIRLAQANAPLLRLAEHEVEALAAMEHWRWSIERRLLGWTCGERRDDAARRHPLLRAWAELDEPERERNRHLARAVPRIAEAAGMGLRRERFIDMSREPSGCGGRAAAAEIAALGPNEQGILLLDPQDIESWMTARRAVEQHFAKIWVIWRAGAPLPAFPKELHDKEGLRPAVENWITEREKEAATGGGQGDAGTGDSAEKRRRPC
jgi:hypothetical protein